MQVKEQTADTKLKYMERVSSLWLLDEILLKAKEVLIFHVQPQTILTEIN